MIREYRTLVKIDLSNIKHNYNAFKKRAEGSIVAPVLKADAYGHGAVEIAKVLEEEGADFFIVATTMEAVKLRKAGIQREILVLGYVLTAQIELFYEYNLTFSLLNLEQLDLIQVLDKKFGKRLKVHINVNTGMNRLGIDINEAGTQLIRELLTKDKIKITGIYSHFAGADLDDLTSAQNQLDRFDKFLKAVKCPDSVMVHISNSAGAINIIRANKSLIRVGISLYGLYPSEDVGRDSIRLKPALSWYAKVISIRSISKGDAVSYGGTFVARNDMKIATLGVGYADGYSRLLSGKGYVLINGKKANILGRVCMDLTVVDVTDIDVNLEDEAVLIGESKDEVISADQIAQWTNTINYEVTCSIGNRVKRIYE